MKHTISLVALIAAMPAFAEETRALDAHEHGVGVLNIAIDGTTVVMEFEAPGADIVGFEYVAESDADLAAIDAAVATLSAPLDLFVMPADAACSVDEHDHDAHAEDDHDEHDHDAHAEDDHDEHDHEEHAEDAHDEHDHDAHAEEAGHSAFHAAYTLTCDNPDAMTSITFAYFDVFANAKEVEVQIISLAGAQAFEVERDAPVLDLGR